MGGNKMVVDTVYGLTIKKNEILNTLRNNPDLPPDDVEFYLNTIEIYNIEIDSIKDF
jgi:hypothetical protein